MRICVDENIPIFTVTELRNLGHDVLDIRGTSDQGAPDDVLWTLAQNQQRLFITTDKGFVGHRDEPHFGLLVIRLRQPNLQKIHIRIMHAIRRFSETEWCGLLVVLRDTVQSVWKAK
jgi:predicted nuclease of predicted toxin-antitoxin system